MKTYGWGGGGGCLDQVFLTSVLDGYEWSASRPCCFTSAERGPGNHWVKGRVDPRVGLDDTEK
jgi:hypothetical protein